MGGRTQRDVTLALMRMFGRSMRSSKTWPYPQDVAWSEIEEPMTENQSVKWVRLPTYFPDFPLAPLPLTEYERQQLRETGWLRRVSFKTVPHATKTEIKLLLRQLYGLDVEKVMTVVIFGKPVAVPETGHRIGRFSDFKKVQVLLRPPEEVYRRKLPT